MLLRERQKEFVQRNIAALNQFGDTLGVAPTGAGKTICLSAVIGEIIEHLPNAKACVLAHRDELTYQNMDKFSLVNPHITTSLFNASDKSWDGQVTFAMVQTLSKEQHLSTMPLFDLLVIDEAHHVTAGSYLSIIEQAKKLNQKVKVFGVTATPVRGDKNSLGQVFTNCADQIRLGELFATGHLVKPKTFIANIEDATEKLQALQVRGQKDYDESEVADILDTVPVNSEVVRIWQEKASDRKTIVFCSTVNHAKNVTDAFTQAGVKVALVTAENTKEQRDQILNAMISDDIQVLVNVALLTEGWDFPPISCVILLRQSSYKATMIQMIGRGLRPIDATIYPDIVKRDCMVLDFGISSILHGSLEQWVELELKGEEGKNKSCPECEGIIPSRISECPLCACDLTALSYKKVTKQKAEIENIFMSEVELLQHSNFTWTELGHDIRMASGFNSWCCVIRQDDIWLSIGGGSRRNSRLKSDIPTSVIYQGDELCAMAAGNDFLNCFEDSTFAKGGATWRELPPTELQINRLPLNIQEKCLKDSSLTRGDVSAILSYVYSAQGKLKELGIRNMMH